MASRQRDYAAEYARRIARGVSRGLSRTQARGHPRTAEAFASGRRSGPVEEYDPRIEEAVRDILRGKPLQQAAREAHVSPERLRRQISRSKFMEKRGGRWRVLQDQVERRLLVYSRGRAEVITVRGSDPASLIGRYMNAVRKFLRTNDASNLAPFRGDSVQDLQGTRYPLETRPNVLYRIDASEPESFEQVYRIVI